MSFSQCITQRFEDFIFFQVFMTNAIIFFNNSRVNFSDEQPEPYNHFLKLSLSSIFLYVLKHFLSSTNIFNRTQKISMNSCITVTKCRSLRKIRGKMRSSIKLKVVFYMFCLVIIISDSTERQTCGYKKGKNCILMPNYGKTSTI